MKIFIIAVGVIAMLIIYYYARKYWRKADVEEKIEENQAAINNLEEIKKEGNAKQAEKAREKIDDFVNSD